MPRPVAARRRDLSRTCSTDEPSPGTDLGHASLCPAEATACPPPWTKRFITDKSGCCPGQQPVVHWSCRQCGEPVHGSTSGAPSSSKPQLSSIAVQGRPGAGDYARSHLERQSVGEAGRGARGQPFDGPLGRPHHGNAFDARLEHGVPTVLKPTGWSSKGIRGGPGGRCLARRQAHDPRKLPQARRRPPTQGPGGAEAAAGANTPAAASV